MKNAKYILAIVGVVLAILHCFVNVPLVIPVILIGAAVIWEAA